MKTHKYKYLSVITLLLLAAINAGAQQPQTYKSGITVSNTDAGVRGDSLYISLDMDMSGLKVDSHRFVDLTPVIRSAGGQEKELPSVRIFGQNRYKAYSRELALAGEDRKTWESEHYAVLRSDKQQEPLAYRYALPIEDWMKGARLELKEDWCGCAGATGETGTELLAENLMPEPPAAPVEVIPPVVAVKPEPEVKRHRQLTAEVHLNFLVSKSDILPGLGNNQQELEKIFRAIEEIKEDKEAAIRQIRIIGYASPEGTLAFNKKLSVDRAAALKNYLATHYELSEDIYQVAFGGENWEGLEKELEASEWNYKAEVLDIIRNTPDVNLRKSKLKTLRGGEPYRHLLREVYPGLRRVDVVVDYEVETESSI